MGIGACGLAAVAAGSSLWGTGHGLTRAETPAPSAAIASAQDLSTAFRRASETVIPSVVTIRSVQTASTLRTPGQQGELPEGFPDDLSPLLKRFFGDDLSGVQPRLELRSPQLPQKQGTGSGVIIDSKGVILTNNHVASAGEVRVTLHDGREFEATEVLTDPKTDLALIRIEGAGELPAAKLGDSDILEIGDWVLAIGAPFGLQETVTAGIISAKSRGVGITETEDFLQTDAAINPGNSGGPLVNLRGEVVGINTAISTRGGGSDGIGFAVPINLARWVSDQLATTGTVQRAFLGVGIQQVTSDISRQLGLTTVQGALISDVQSGSAAEQAGLTAGDVVIEFDGRPVDSPRKLQNLVERANLGEKHSVTIVRDGQRRTIEVDLQQRQDTIAASDTSVTRRTPTSQFDELGLDVSELTSDIASQLGVQDVSGVVITDVQPGSIAATVGLEAGMVITRVGTRPVQRLTDFHEATQDANLDDGVLLLVRTSEGSRFVVLKK
ncbi:MAG: Do family serine endopeptidase [Planctomycetaceae bacterium]